MIHRELGLGALEELVVLRVGSWPSALDEGDAELVEQLRDLELVACGQRDPLLLRAVAEGRVVDFDEWSVGHDGLSVGDLS